MKADTFQIVENEKNLEYFAYVREVMQAKQINYWIGNPSVQIINGSIFLKQNPITQQTQQLYSHQEYLKQYRQTFLRQNSDNQHKVAKTLALVGIPNSKTPVQVCEKLAAYMDWIVQLRVVKTNHFKYYAILLLLKDQQTSAKFCTELQGEQYNGLEIQRILIRQVIQISYTHVEAIKADIQPLFQHRKKSNIGNEQIQNKKLPQQIFLRSNLSKQSETSGNLFGGSPRKKQMTMKITQISPTNKQTQQQTCTICFDNIQGTIISLLCCHYFHVECLSQWKQNICPLCRYHQQPPVIKFCQKCNQCQGLWICLVCGVRLCCGQDNNILGSDSHIYEHYLQSYHKLSMDVQTKFIFDASQPAFLHQMFYKQVLKNDVLQLDSEKKLKKGKKTKLSQKISQYEQNISEQMQKQRAYFQQNISKQVKKRKQLIKQKKKTIAQLQQQIAQIDKQTEQMDSKKQQLQKQSGELQKQIKIAQENHKKLKQVTDKKQLQIKLKSEQQKIIIKQLDALIAEKKQQLKDFRKNKQLSAKIKSNLGKDQVQSAIIFQMGNKQVKKKKK